jgi:Zn-dependent peptidase ImmA (M78 family)
MTLRRGFKAEAERLVERYRHNLALGTGEPIDPFKLAKLLDIEIVAADQLISRSRLLELEDIQAGAFSACTFRPLDRTVIVYNPLNAVTRQRSDIAHELGHIILDHRLSKVERVGDLAFYTCDADQEEEAAWLSGCLLLPRQLLLRELRRGRTVAQIATGLHLSERMVRYRVNATGAALQLQRERRRTMRR